jgi:voltage-gated potassium channel
MTGSTGSGVRRWLFERLDPAARPNGLSLANKILTLAIIVSVAVAILETEASVAERFVAAFEVAEVAFTILFLAEYLARIWIAPEDPRYAHPIRGRLRWMATPTAVIDLLALIPALVFMGAEPVYLLRLFRLARILRIAKLGRMSSAMRLMGEAIAERRFELLLSLAAAVVVLILSSTAMYLVEGAQNPEAFGSIPRAMWWSIITLTTIGYGDVFPVTLAGRTIAGFTALCGIGLIAAPTGILSAAFSDALSRRRALKGKKGPDA